MADRNPIEALREVEALLDDLEAVRNWLHALPFEIADGAINQRIHDAIDRVWRLHGRPAETRCPDCGRHVMVQPAAATGYLAPCGRRLTRIGECAPSGRARCFERSPFRERPA